MSNTTLNIHDDDVPDSGLHKLMNAEAQQVNAMDMAYGRIFRTPKVSSIRQQIECGDYDVDGAKFGVAVDRAVEEVEAEDGERFDGLS